MQTVRFRPLAMVGVTLALALSSTTMASAQSGSTFLLQLGQFDSQDAARSQWDMLQKRYPQQLGNLSLRVAPVQSQGKEVFRTQAAGVASYAQAQSICSDLSASSATCSIVETSMYQPEDTAVAVSGSARPSAAPVASPALGAVDELAVEQGVVAVPAPAPQPVATAAADDRSFGEKYLPWLGFGKDKKEAQPAEPAKQPVEQQMAQAAPVAAASPQDAAPAEWEPMEVSARPESNASRVERNAATQQVMANERAVRTSPVGNSSAALAARAPRNLNEEYAAIPAQPQVPMESVHVGGDAEVAEAVQVPLTTGNSGGQPVILSNKPVGFGGFPSQPAPANSSDVWVQVGQFSTKEAAFAFSRELARSHPDVMQFSRVRVVGAVDSRRMGSRTDVSSLRMGPFKEANQINRICGIAKEKGLRCTTMREIGASSARGNGIRQRFDPATRASQRGAVSRGYNRTAGVQPMGAYWVQLGAFDSTTAAQQRWSELSQTNKDAFSNLKPQISYPALSSASAPVYHLRTGPFVNQVAAFDLCGKLQARRLSCVVVQAR